jgi:hypothetical protein
MKTTTSDKIGANRLPNGKFGPGNVANPHGRPAKPEIEELRQALAIVAKTQNKEFLIHFIERAYQNDMVAVALAKKILPDKIEGQGFGDGIKIIIVREKKGTGCRT